MGLPNLFVSLLLIISSEVFPSSGCDPEISVYVSVYEGMNAELWCSAGSTISEGQFMWSYEQNGTWQTVAIRKGSTLQESFRKRIYANDKQKGTLSNNSTINEKFNGRVNISGDGKLILRNSTVQDSGLFKCSYKGFTDRGLPNESLVNLSVNLFKATAGKTVKTTSKPTSQIFKDCSRELHSYKVATVILSVIAGILALFVAFFVGYIFYRRYNNRP